MILRLSTASENFCWGDPLAEGKPADRPRRSPLFENSLGRAQFPPLQMAWHLLSLPEPPKRVRRLRRDPVGAPPVGALAPLSLTVRGIFIGDTKTPSPRLTAPPVSESLPFKLGFRLIFAGTSR